MRSAHPGLVQVVQGAGPVYNEAAFHYFLALELRRAKRSAQRLLLLLVSLRRHHGEDQRLTPRTAAAVFSVLGSCVREVDFVGWHREAVVAAALLNTGGAATSRARHIVCDRIGRVLDQTLAFEDAARIDVRAVELGRRPTE
jgi:hypothetical protein